MLIGHLSARRAFLDAIGRGRLHHAWLISGPRGIGKRRFADWAALSLLSASASMDEPPADSEAAHLLASGAHPDHRLLTPPEEGRGSATASIIVDQVRALADFLHSHPAIAPWRTLIVDSIDDMNPNTANAFLKELEEPGERTVYLLVSHAPARLLPTIRSRCRMLRLFPLADGEARAVLRESNPDLADAERESLLRLADGAPGSVQELGGAGLVELERLLGGIAAGADPLPLVRSLQSPSALPKFRALLALVPRKLAEAARRHPDPRWFPLYAEAETLQRDSIRLAYDRQQVAMALTTITARMGRIQGQQ